MKLYTKQINGKTETKRRNQIVIHKDGMQVINPPHEMIIEDGWEEYIAPVYEPTEEELLADAKRNKKREITEYDSSDEVNCFYMEDQKMWLDKATRVGLKLRFETELADGETNTTLWYEGTPYKLPLENAVKMLYAIEKYASKCYDNTQMHIAYVNIMEDIETIESYDYRTGYPEKLRF
jgi:hypothetical protein